MLLAVELRLSPRPSPEVPFLGPCCSTWVSSAAAGGSVIAVSDESSEDLVAVAEQSGRRIGSLLMLVFSLLVVLVPHVLIDILEIFAGGLMSSIFVCAIVDVAALA